MGTRHPGIGRRASGHAEERDDLQARSTKTKMVVIWLSVGVNEIERKRVSGNDDFIARTRHPPRGRSTPHYGVAVAQLSPKQTRRGKVAENNTV